VVSEVMSNEKLIENLEALAKDSFIQIESYNYMVNYWTNFYLYSGILTTLLAAIASASSLSKLIETNIAAGTLSAGVAIISGVTTFINPSDNAGQHRKAKDKFVLIYTKARNVAVDSYLEESNEVMQKLKDELKDLSNKIAEATQTSPQIPEWVRKIAERRTKVKFRF
jgi:hypothetical protein